MMANVFKSIVLHHVLLDNFSVATTFVAMLTHYAIFITMEFVQNVFLDIIYSLTTPVQLIWSVIQDNIFLIMFVSMLAQHVAPLTIMESA